tara:strand:+ start:203 stop:739 length:537 start_codon:yes stop_codon:yes gene_type:complete
MKSEKTIDQKFRELESILKNRDKQSIKMDAHGGHTVLFIYPPNEEITYLEKVKEEYPKAELINVADLLIEYIDQFGLEKFTEAYSDYQSEPQKLFKDFLKMIISKIENAGVNNKLPVLIRSGALSGTGIENISIMDSPIVHKLPIPLVILYPATEAGDKRLKFLNYKPASDYRSVVIY